MDAPKIFHLEREVDCTGVSGLGLVAYGVIWEDGQVTLKWETTLSVFPNIEAVERIHGHGGNTKIIYDSNERG